MKRAGTTGVLEFFLALSNFFFLMFSLVLDVFWHGYVQFLTTVLVNKPKKDRRIFSTSLNAKKLLL